MRILIAGLAFGAALLPETASACAACFGKSDSKMAQGMNMGIFSLLAVVVFMQVAVGGFFFVFLKKRAAKLAAARAASAQHVFSAAPSSPSPPSEGGEGWGEEGCLAGGSVVDSALGCPSPRPSPRSFLTGRGSAVRALHTSSAEHEAVSRELSPTTNQD